MTDDELRQQLGRIEERLAALQGSVNALILTADVTKEQIAALLAWAQEKPSTGLRDVLAELAAAVSGVHGAVVALGNYLPGEVAKAVLAEVRRQPGP